jgi:hypothetical protein
MEAASPETYRPLWMRGTDDESNCYVAILRLLDMASIFKKAAGLWCGYL